MIDPFSLAIYVCILFCTDYTHVIAIGNNEPNRLLQAFARYSAGGDGYVDPVAFDDVFVANNGTLEFSFVPMITVRAAIVLIGWLIHLVGII